MHQASTYSVPLFFIIIIFIPFFYALVASEAYSLAGGRAIRVTELLIPEPERTLSYQFELQLTVSPTASQNIFPLVFFFQYHSSGLAPSEFD